MNTELLSYQNNDEIASIMNKKFASKFKSEENSAFYQNDSLSNIIRDISDENTYEYKLNRLVYLFPSIPKEKIERIFINNKDVSLKEGIELLKEMLISQNSKQEINDNNNNNIHLSKRRNKRNYNSLLSQTQMQKQTQFPLINNINNYMAQKNIDNNIKINKIEKENSRKNIFENNNKEKVKEKEDERKKLELKTVDLIAEELLNSKDQEDLKKYLFNQLVLLEEKKEKDRKNGRILKGIDILEKDRFSLEKCLSTNIRLINKKTTEVHRLDCKINELNEEINKVRGRILYQESIGRNIYLSMQKFKKLEIN